MFPLLNKQYHASRHFTFAIILLIFKEHTQNNALGYVMLQNKGRNVKLAPHAHISNNKYMRIIPV